MKTIFDYAATKLELTEIFCYDERTDTMAFGFSVQLLPRSRYDTESTRRSKLLDLARLLEFRGLKEEALGVWLQIPDIYDRYSGGFDSQILPL